MTDNVKRSKPRCEIEFHTPTAFYSAEGKFDPTDNVISVTTDKSLDGVAGTFSINMVYHNIGSKTEPETWYDRLNPMDVVVIKMGRPPEALDTVMVGVIDEVRRTRSMPPDGGTPSRRVTINGRDFGKVFLKAMLEFFPTLSVGDLPLDMLTGANTLLGLREFFFSGDFEYGTAAQLIYKGITQVLYNLMGFEAQLYDAAHGSGGQPKIATLKEMMRFRLCRTNMVLPFINTLAEYEGSFWNFIESSVNKPFYELFLDTRTADEIMQMVPPAVTEFDSFNVGDFEQEWGEDRAKVCLFLRPTPFNTDDWDALTTHVIDDADIMSEDLGRADHENQNMWRVRPSVKLVADTVYDAYVTPEFDFNNIKRYGISYYQADLLGLNPMDGTQDGADPVSIGIALSKKLREWYWRNIWFENGSISLRGNGKIKVGQRVRNPSEYHNHIYYVEAVHQEFINYSDWSTSVQVTRGQDYVNPTDGNPAQSPTELNTYEKDAVTGSSVPSSSSSSSKAATDYIVKKGDTLSALVVKFYGKFNQSLIDLVMNNNPQITSPDKIYEGQKITFPASTT